MLGGAEGEPWWETWVEAPTVAGSLETPAWGAGRPGESEEAGAPGGSASQTGLGAGATQPQRRVSGGEAGTATHADAQQCPS